MQPCMMYCVILFIGLALSNCASGQMDSNDIAGNNMCQNVTSFMKCQYFYLILTIFSFLESKFSYKTKAGSFCVQGWWNGGAPFDDGALQECSTALDCMKKCNQDIRCGAFAIYQEMRRGYTARNTIRCVYNPLWNTYIKNSGMI